MARQSHVYTFTFVSKAQLSPGRLSGKRTVARLGGAWPARQLLPKEGKLCAALPRTTFGCGGGRCIEVWPDRTIMGPQDPRKDESSSSALLCVPYAMALMLMGGSATM